MCLFFGNINGMVCVMCFICKMYIHIGPFYVVNMFFLSNRLYYIQKIYIFTTIKGNKYLLRHHIDLLNTHCISISIQLSASIQFILISSFPSLNRFQLTLLFFVSTWLPDFRPCCSQFLFTDVPFPWWETGIQVGEDVRITLATKESFPCICTITIGKNRCLQLGKDAYWNTLFSLEYPSLFGTATCSNIGYSSLHLTPTVLRLVRNGLISI